LLFFYNAPLCVMWSRVHKILNVISDLHARWCSEPKCECQMHLIDLKKKL
jgi:hypothetical protein